MCASTLFHDSRRQSTFGDRSSSAVLGLGVRRNKSFQSVGGAAQLDEVREAVQLERIVAVEQQLSDFAVVAEAALDGQTLEVSPNTPNAINRIERRWKTTDKQLDDLGVVVELDRQPQRGLAVGVRDAQNVRSRQRLDQRKRRSVYEQLRELLLFGVHSPAGAAMVSVRSGAVCLSLV